MIGNYSIACVTKVKHPLRVAFKSSTTVCDNGSYPSLGSHPRNHSAETHGLPSVFIYVSV